MAEQRKEERRRQQRRKGKDRRIGEMDNVYRRLVSKGIIQDTRVGERRIKERRKEERRQGLFRLGDEEKYALYMVGMEKINLQRKKAGLGLLPVLAFGQWSLQTAPKQ